MSGKKDDGGAVFVGVLALFAAFYNRCKALGSANLFNSLAQGTGQVKLRIRGESVAGIDLKATEESGKGVLTSIKDEGSERSKARALALICGKAGALVPNWALGLPLVITYAELEQLIAAESIEYEGLMADSTYRKLAWGLMAHAAALSGKKAPSAASRVERDII